MSIEMNPDTGPRAEARTGRVLLCRCRHGDIPGRDVRREVEEKLAGADVDVVDDLCGLAARRDPLLAQLAAAAELYVVACHARAVRWLFAFGGAPLDEQRSHLLDTRSRGAEEILSALGSPPVPASGAQPADTAAPQAPPPGGDDWIPWFPVIDYDRCTNCLKCLGFCLFGAFAKDADGRVVVAKPANCKTNCPACGRVCPQVAIIFPKYNRGAISGAQVTDEDMQREPAKVDLSKLAGGDVYAALRGRTVGKKGAEAGQGKLASLKELQQKLDIPSDVLRSLGGPTRND